MTLASNGQAAIIRTERGLTISGARISLYDVMNYVTAQYPPKFIQGLFELTEEQINAALAHIEANRAAVEAEYQMVLKEAEELRLYYKKNVISLPNLHLNPRNPDKKLFERNFKPQKPSLNLGREFFG